MRAGRVWIALGAGWAGAWVGLSAAVAHVPALAQAGASLDSALRMQAVHALALLAVGLLQLQWPSRWWAAAGCAFVAGLLLFCLNIQLRLLLGWEGGRPWVPLGGVAFMLGWALLVLGAWRAPRRSALG